jgi:hypothetical protein
MSNPLYRPSSIFDLYGNLLDIPTTVATWPHLTGDYPYAIKNVSLAGEVTPEEIAQVTGFALERCSTTGSKDHWSASYAADGLTVLVRVNGDYHVTVYAKTSELAASAVALLATCGVAKEVTLHDDEVSCVFRYKSEYHVTGNARTLKTPAWEDIARNYSTGTRSALTTLMKLTSPGDAGKLILLHGPAGTGKTTAIRALIREWKKWCSAEYILDPDALLSQSSYMHDLLFDTRASISEKGQEKKSCRLFIIEDADEVLGSKHDKVKQSFSHLLNLSDGILGHELDALFLVTTNEKLGALHSALRRPGRAMAEIEIGKLSASESRVWLGDPSVALPPGDHTLAELFEALGSLQQIRTEKKPPVSAGQYL